MQIFDQLKAWPRPNSRAGVIDPLNPLFLQPFNTIRTNESGVKQLFNMHLSEQEIIRREKLKGLEQLGINPYPAELYPVDTTAAYIKQHYKGEENKADFSSVTLAGRIMSIRDMGKASFSVLQDSSGKIQLYLKKDDIPDFYDKVWKHFIDIGDIIGVKGFVFTTKTGETSVHVKEIVLLSKSLKPLPVVKEKEGETFDAVTDPEFRYRQRYADLIVNPADKRCIYEAHEDDQHHARIPE